MAVKHADPGGSATGGTQQLSNISGSVTAQTGITNGQAYAYLFNTISPAAGATAKAAVGLLQAAGNRISGFSRVPVLSADNTSVTALAVTPTGSNTSLLNVTIGSDGKLRLYTNGITTALGAAGASVVAVNTWRRITLSYAITTTTNWSAKVYLDGVLEMTRTNADGTLSSAAPTDIQLGLRLGAGTNYLLYLSDLYVDDTTDQSDPAAGTGNGEMHVGARLPTTNTTNGFDTVIGSGAVNERPVSTTNGWRHNATGDVDQDYDIEALSDGDANLTGATIVGHLPWIWAALGSLTGTPLGHIISNGARLAGTWDPASANVAQFFSGPPVTSATYPKNANGKNAGTSSSQIAADTFLYDCGVIVAYIPAAPGGATVHRQLLLGVGT